MQCCGFTEKLSHVSLFNCKWSEACCTVLTKHESWHSICIHKFNNGPTEGKKRKREERQRERSFITQNSISVGLQHFDILHSTDLPLWSFLCPSSLFGLSSVTRFNCLVKCCSGWALLVGSPLPLWLFMTTEWRELGKARRRVISWTVMVQLWRATVIRCNWEGKLQDLTVWGDDESQRTEMIQVLLLNKQEVYSIACRCSQLYSHVATSTATLAPSVLHWQQPHDGLP